MHVKRTRRRTTTVLITLRVRRMLSLSKISDYFARAMWHAFVLPSIFERRPDSKVPRTCERYHGLELPDARGRRLDLPVAPRTGTRLAMGERFGSVKKTGTLDKHVTKKDVCVNVYGANVILVED